jgi:hypothetical protein
LEEAGFSKPVLLKLPTGPIFAASTTHLALNYLDRYWPIGRTVHYRRARALCEAAAQGRASAEEARCALADAARRARVLVDDWTTDKSSSRTRAEACLNASCREERPTEEDVDEASDARTLGVDTGWIATNQPPPAHFDAGAGAK